MIQILFDFSYSAFQVLRRKFWGIFCPPASIVNPKFSTFLLVYVHFVSFQSLAKFLVWSFLFCISFVFCLILVLISWLVEVLEHILAFSLKQHLMYYQQSLAEEKLMCPWSWREGFCKIRFVCPSFHLTISFLGIGPLIFSET